MISACEATVSDLSVALIPRLLISAFLNPIHVHFPLYRVDVISVGSKDGYEADFVVVHPEETKIEPDTPMIMIHPALGIPGRYYTRLAERLCSRNGWIVAIQEQRGQGSSSWTASSYTNWGYWTPIAVDFDLHLSTLRSKFPSNPLFILGHSAGAILWCLWMSKQLIEGKESEVRRQIAGLIVIASGVIDFRIHPSRTLFPFSLFVASVSYLLGWFPGERLGFGGPAEAKNFMLDWCHNIWTGKWNPKGCPYEDITSTFSKIPVPAYFTTLDNDVFTPPVCCAKFSEFLNPATTTYVTIESKKYDEYRDMPGELAHIRWARGDTILPFIEAYVAQILTPRSAKL